MDYVELMFIPSMVGIIVCTRAGLAGQDVMNTTIAFGLLSTFLSNPLNNLPTVMSGTFAVLDMSFSPLLV